MSFHGKFPAFQGLPARGGVGLKPEHYRLVVDTTPDVGFFEVHAENYMGAGGSPHRYLEKIREAYPLSLHGVGLSIGADKALDKDHLRRLRDLNARYRPSLVSEHLAWSTHDEAFVNDLLPAPYTEETLARVCEHIDEVQSALGRQMLLENPTSYLTFTQSTWSETDFIGEISQRTGCGLLLDVNNIHVSCTNLQWDAQRYIADFPLAKVQEIHLAGHEREQDEKDRPLLIDTHDRPVDEIVWALYANIIARRGAVATLIEWDSKVPEWPILQAEAARADAIMTGYGLAEARHAAAR